MATTKIVEFRAVEKQYGGKIVFQAANLEITTGEFVVLRGESGAGKST